MAEDPSPLAPWLNFLRMEVYVARYAKQSREVLREMPLSTFFAWFHASVEMIRKEGETDE